MEMGTVLVEYSIWKLLVKTIEMTSQIHPFVRYYI